MNIDELADAVGLTRRAIRFYVQQKLLPAPLGVGRGKHYDETHRDRLRRIQELQGAGYSLDAIRRLLTGESVPEPSARSSDRSAASPNVPGRPFASAELWTRLKVAEGCELHLDVKRFPLDPQQLAAAREALRSLFGLESDSSKQEHPPETKAGQQPEP